MKRAHATSAWSWTTGTVIAVAAFSAAAWCAAQGSSGGGGGSIGVMPSPLPERPPAGNAPADPGTPSRPGTWPGGNPQPAGNPGQGLPPGELKPCAGTAILARVGQYAVLECEVMAIVNQAIEENKDRIPPEELDRQRELILKQALRDRIETLMVFQEAKRTIPAENWDHVLPQLEKQFDEVELDRLLKQSHTSNRHELDLKLRSYGSSLETKRQTFCQHYLAQMWVSQQVKQNNEITYDQTVGYYQTHKAEFTKPTRACWEELMAAFSNYPSDAATYDAIARMGNQVLAGAPLGNVARANSDGLTAANGGQRGWVSKGSLACKELNDALFSLPVGQLSPIIRSTTGYHIIRVTDREDAAVTPFVQAQVEIREKIVRERSQKQVQDYMAKLKAKTPIWTIFDDDSRGPQTANQPRPGEMRR